MSLWKVRILLVLDLLFCSSIARVAAFFTQQRLSTTLFTGSSYDNIYQKATLLSPAKSSHFKTDKATSDDNTVSTTQAPSTETRTWALSAVPPTKHDHKQKSELEIPSVPLLLLGITWVMMIAASLGVFWSEWAILQTGCGPMFLPDWLERGCYLGVLVVSSVSVFTRIVALAILDGMDGEGSGGGLASLLLVTLKDDQTSFTGDSPTKNHPTSEKNIRILLQVADYLALFAVAAAVVVLGSQVLNGETMDGLSGIDLVKCRARQSFQQNLL